MNAACRHCWSASHRPDYLRCHFCGTLKHRAAPKADDLYTADYWSHERGHSTLHEQKYNVETHEEYGVTKNRCLLNRIDVQAREAVLEIGCAPGCLLGALRKEAGFKSVVGIEVPHEWEDDLREIAGCPVYLYFGLFPQVTGEFTPRQFDLIIASDVFEHSHEPEAFLRECARLTKKGGQLLMMVPLAGKDVPDRFFCEEHVYLHSGSNLAAMLCDAGFAGAKFSRWTAGHDLLSARRAD